MITRRDLRVPVLLVLGLLALTGSAAGVLLSERPSPSGRTVVGTWVTSPTDPARRLSSIGSAPHHGAEAVVHLDPGRRAQRWRGAGAALTDASEQALAGSPDAVRRLFDPRRESGAALTWVRLPLTATDFSPTAWTWGWDGAVASPAPQARAAIARVRVLADLQPGLRVVATPWTAPEWMKQPRGVRGGSLRDDQVRQYAALLVAQAEALRDEGVPLAAITLGNEPGFGADYPSMTMSDRQQSKLARLVAPQLEDLGVELWAVDHNWADRARYDSVLAGAPDAFAAAAFHCYAGDPGQMSGTAVPPVVTECTGTTGDWGESFAWQARRLVAESIAAGSTGLIMWNLALDPSGGPVDRVSTQGCRTCRGLVQVDDDRITAGPEFYLLAHLARAADPGAHVVAARADPGLAVAGFANPDGTLGAFVHNDTGADRVLVLRAPGRGDVRREVRAGELVSVRLPG